MRRYPWRVADLLQFRQHDLRVVTQSGIAALLQSSPTFFGAPAPLMSAALQVHGRRKSAPEQHRT